MRCNRPKHRNGLRAGAREGGFDVTATQPAIGEHVVEGVHHVGFGHYRQCRHVFRANLTYVDAAQSSGVERRVFGGMGQQPGQALTLGRVNLVGVPGQRREMRLRRRLVRRFARRRNSSHADTVVVIRRSEVAACVNPKAGESNSAMSSSGMADGFALRSSATPVEVAKMNSANDRAGILRVSSLLAYTSASLEAR